MDGHAVVSGDLTKAITLEKILGDARAAENKEKEKKK